MTNENRVQIVKEGDFCGYYVKVDGFTESFCFFLWSARRKKRKLISILNKYGDLNRVVG
jgi:hypothetical protein